MSNNFCPKCNIDETMKILLVGAGAREAAFAHKLLAEGRCSIYAIMSHANPSIVDYVEQSHGSYCVANHSDPQQVLRFAQQCQVDYAFVSADEPLANGVVDVLLEYGIKAVGGTKAATRIEWDKVYSIRLMQQIAPKHTPFFQVVDCVAEIDDKLAMFQQQGMQVVVKPNGLTGGKGVRVMPVHLPSFADARAYILELLQHNPAQSVLLVEKIHGIEFTIMGISDGKRIVLAPASYDYPFRFEDDLGAGTGGMGCYTDSTKQLPFMSAQHWLDCQQIMQKVVSKLQADGHHFNGVLNGGFFVTPKGVQFMEFNARFGDPEGINVLSVMQGSFTQLVVDLATQNLRDIDFLPQASVSKYLVAQEYPQASPKATLFQIDHKLLQAQQVTAYTGACTIVSNVQTMSKYKQYQTLKKIKTARLGCRC